MNEYQLTPVEKFGKYSFKREDLYRPFDFSPVNGSKLRQCQILVQKNANYNGFVTGTSIKSPQAPILSAVGKSINKPVTIMYGGTTLLAAAQCGRKCYGFEIDKNFYKLANEKVLINIQQSLF